MDPQIASRKRAPLVHLSHPDHHIPGFEVPAEAAGPMNKKWLVLGAVLAAGAALLSFWFEHLGEKAAAPSVAMPWVLPFVLLLACIATMPFIAKHFWEKNYQWVSIGLGAIVSIYYVVFLHAADSVAKSMGEYISFIFLLGSLFVVSGGILIRVRRKATPLVNTVLLLVGAILANVFGTTGASMLLIRPFLRINKGHIRPYHVVFFIFSVSNLGGSLTPIGDPPLFLGYLKGVPFFWLLTKPDVLLAWLLCVGSLLALFFVFDSRNKAGTEPPAEDRVEMEGTHNFLWLFAIIGLVLMQKADWLHGKLDENLVTTLVAVAMIGVACLSHKFASRDALAENEFSFGPVKEVGFLFAGIFVTMVPALDLLEKHAGELGIRTVMQFYWGSGALSSVLDNAPTYLNFLTAAFGLQHLSLETPQHVARMLAEPALARYIVAVSLGSVFFGAMTYIGNGPNFMVKSIAEAAGVKCPSFFGYVFKYSLPILIPLFALVGWLFLR